MSIIEKLYAVQKNLKCPKSQFNAFGKYNYRNCEDILNGVKKCIKDLFAEINATVTVTDDIVLVGDRYYVKATATFNDGTDSISTTAFAREPQIKKGMDESQITGAASSYARKYALCGLFALDDTKDADSQDNRNIEPTQPEKPYNAAQKEIFDKAIKEKDAVALWALKSVSTEDAYLALYGSFAPGAKTANKKICQELEPKGQAEWAELVPSIEKMIDAEDAMGLAEENEGLSALKRNYLKSKLGIERYEQYQDLIAGVPTNEPD